MSIQISEEQIRRRTVKGAAFEGLPDDEYAAIKEFLAGGDPANLPERWHPQPGNVGCMC